jgi:tRNA(fMet)-specific endonuclease VapC
MFGVVMSRRTEQDRAALDVFLRHVAVVDYPATAAEHYAAVREALYWKEGMIGTHELLVAAHARSLGTTLVTGRTRTLGLVPGFSAEKWGK